MSHKVNLVRVFTAATGNSTPITLGAAYSQLFMTPAEAGAMDGRVYTYLIVDGNDWEMGRGAYTASGASLARTTIIASRISGTLGTSRITMTGTAQVRFIESAEDMDGVRGTRAVTSTSDVLANSDQGYVVTYSNGSPIAVSLAQAGSSNLFLAGWATRVQNTGVGTVTVTPATSTINGASTLTLATGMGAFIWSDGTNYRAQFVPASKPLLAANALSEIATLGKQADARTNLGFTTVGKALAVAADAAAGRSAIGAANIAGEIFTGSVAVRSGTDGYLQLASGNTSLPGVTSFYTPDGIRRGYIGWGSGSFNTITGENGWNWRVIGADLALDNALHVGTSSNLGYTSRINVKYVGGGIEFGSVFKQDHAAGGTAVYFLNSSGTNIGSITTSNTATAFNTSSDHRLKKDIQAVADEDALNRLRATRVVEFSYLGETIRQVGVLAHEQQEVRPWAVTGGKDGVEKLGTATNAEGKVVAAGITEAMAPEDTTWAETGERPVYQVMDYSKLEADHMAASKAMLSILEDLIRRVLALESRG